MEYFTIVLERKGDKACLVFSCTKTSVTCISLFASAAPFYSSVYAPICDLESLFGLANKDPADHEAIHVELAKPFQIEADSTKTHTTHFHWVCAKPLDGGQIMTMWIALSKSAVDLFSSKQVKPLVQSLLSQE